MNFKVEAQSKIHLNFEIDGKTTSVVMPKKGYLVPVNSFVNTGDAAGGYYDGMYFLAYGIEAFAFYNFFDAVDALMEADISKESARKIFEYWEECLGEE